RLAGAVELVYDKANSIVIGFGPTERPSDAVFSVIVYPRWVSLCFLAGASLADPDKILQGSGHIVRHIRLDEGARRLDDARVKALMKAALADADVKMPRGATRRMLIRAISARHR